MDKVRLFTAIDIDQSGIEKIFILQEKLKKLSKFIRWTDKSTWHLTLKFLGEQTTINIPKYIELCESIKLSLSPFHLTLKGTGAFPNLDFPRIIFVNLIKSDYLASLYNLLQDGFEKYGIPKEKRSFSPHLTLGRIKEPEKIKQTNPSFILDFIKLGETFEYSFEVNRFILYQSILKPDGPQYIAIKSFIF